MSVILAVVATSHDNADRNRIQPGQKSVAGVKPRAVQAAVALTI
jgi:hypothetical protein